TTVPLWRARGLRSPSARKRACPNLPSKGLLEALECGPPGSSAFATDAGPSPDHSRVGARRRFSPLSGRSGELRRRSAARSWLKATATSEWRSCGDGLVEAFGPSTEDEAEELARRVGSPWPGWGR